MMQNNTVIRIGITVSVLAVFILSVTGVLRDALRVAWSANVSTSAPIESRFQTAYTHVVRIAGRNISVEAVDTPEGRQQGLSGRPDLAPDAGMLFIFEKDDYHAFWMKDMRFSIDIVWISADGQVVSIASNVSPKTYPHSFQPKAPARYVLELPAGFSNKYRLEEGDPVQL
ncbi:DUF192 domain-containing protein [Candidatus Kaiserbacteria bacterium]|nr:DUF192 domain-containing protein [Candidatus Kaiserbacteria bacterium]